MSPEHVDSNSSDEANSLLEISNAVVRQFKQQFGRGPSNARTYWAGPDALAVILEDTLTPTERTMVTMGEHQRLRDMRLFFQVASTREFCEPIERITGRTVRAFVSGTDTHVEGLSVEMFVLHPHGFQGASRADAELV